MISFQFTPMEVLLEMALLKEFAKNDPWNAIEYKREFSHLAEQHSDSLVLDIERVFDRNNNSFNVMAPVGGPWFIDKNTSVHVTKWLPCTYEVIFDCYIGHLSIFDNKCGMDNLKILMNNVG